MLTANYTLQVPITDSRPKPVHQRISEGWYSPDDSSASGSFVLFIGEPFAAESALTKPVTEVDDEPTRFSFKPAPGPVSTALIEAVFDDIFSLPTVPFKREFEADLGD